MPDRIALTLYEGYSATYRGTVTRDSTPLDLNGVALQMRIKPSASTPDDDPEVLLLESGQDITLDDEPGAYTVRIPASPLLEPGVRWCRVHAVVDAEPMLVVYGPVMVRDM